MEVWRRYRIAAIGAVPIGAVLVALLFRWFSAWLQGAMFPESGGDAGASGTMLIGAATGAATAAIAAIGALLALIAGDRRLRRAFGDRVQLAAIGAGAGVFTAWVAVGSGFEVLSEGPHDGRLVLYGLFLGALSGSVSALLAGMTAAIVERRARASGADESNR